MFAALVFGIMISLFFWYRFKKSVWNHQDTLDIIGIYFGLMVAIVSFCGIFGQYVFPILEKNLNFLKVLGLAVMCSVIGVVVILAFVSWIDNKLNFKD